MIIVDREFTASKLKDISYFALIDGYKKSVLQSHELETIFDHNTVKINQKINRKFLRLH